ncbi:ABC transporter ATP-binding protein [Streptacidiphilus cavernicola]|uniref:ABC transporter ATP-binding protein n=1 Tax=Streptacidiphilus cavernicola TaxID=3342716 RepID=A0ABV6W362_9ACTN
MITSIGTAAARRLQLLRMLREAGPAVLLGYASALLLGSVTPAATAAVLALLVSRLDTAATGSTLFDAALLPLALFGGVLLLGHLGDAAATPLEYLARSRVDGAQRARIARLVLAGPTVGALETPEVQAAVRGAIGDPDRGPDRTVGLGAVAALRRLAALAGAVASCAVLAGYAWWLLPVLLVPAGACGYLRFRQGVAVNETWRFADREELHADVWRQAVVSPSEGKDIRVFGLADWLVRRLQRHIDVANAPLWTVMLRIARGEWLPLLLVSAGLVPAYTAVTWSAVHGHSTVAVQTAVLAAGWSLVQALGSGGELLQITGANSALAGYDRLRGTLGGEAAALPDRGALPSPRQPAGGGPPLVRFEQVGFGYPGGARAVLDRLDLEIRPGELLAVVGLNGAGKSTLIKLLSGLYRPTSGRITVDGAELTARNTGSWRSRIAVVFQDFVRYQLSAADNVVLGAAHDRAALDLAARDAGFAPVLARLPDGWDTPLARSRTGGVDLSGGQWQQLVLTRALYAVRTGAQLLVLDEPTAHLDVRTEFEVFRRLAEHRGRTSVVLISHRLSTVRRADRIVLLDGGRITESGTHEELMARGGGYADLFTVQAERFAAAGVTE